MAKQSKHPNGRFKKRTPSKMVALTCACGVKFAVERKLFNQAAGKKVRDVYCPTGHEMSWRGGTLGGRLKTENLIERELEQQRRLMENLKDMFSYHKRIIAALENDIAKQESGMAAKRRRKPVRAKIRPRPPMAPEANEPTSGLSNGSQAKESPG